MYFGCPNLYFHLIFDIIFDHLDSILTRLTNNFFCEAWYRHWIPKHASKACKSHRWIRWPSVESGLPTSSNKCNQLLMLQHHSLGKWLSADMSTNSSDSSAFGGPVEPLVYLQRRQTLRNQAEISDIFSEDFSKKGSRSGHINTAIESGFGCTGSFGLASNLCKNCYFRIPSAAGLAQIDDILPHKSFFLSTRRSKQYVSILICHQYAIGNSIAIAMLGKQRMSQKLNACCLN